MPAYNAEKTLHMTYAELPHDIMTGAPYQYHLHADGTYLLYSVGWDQHDDGGDGIKAQGKTTDDAPDWVWPSHPDAPKTK